MILVEWGKALTQALPDPCLWRSPTRLLAFSDIFPFVREHLSTYGKSTYLIPNDADFYYMVVKFIPVTVVEILCSRWSTDSKNAPLPVVKFHCSLFKIIPSYRIHRPIETIYFLRTKSKSLRPGTNFLRCSLHSWKKLCFCTNTNSLPNILSPSLSLPLPPSVPSSLLPFPPKASLHDRHGYS